jgi:hypothetical protein
LIQLFDFVNGFLKTSYDLTKQAIFLAQQSECIQFLSNSIERPMSIIWFCGTGDNDFPRSKQEQDDIVVFESVD